MTPDRLHIIRPIYPFESHYLDVGDGVRLHYLDEGRGPALVMLHGNPTWSFYYRNLVRDLRDSWRIVVPDHIGCGLSDKPQAYPYTLKTHIDNVERLVNHLGLDDFTLVLHDWGGAIGFGLAVRQPQRVRRFVVFNTAAFLGTIPFRIRLCRTPLLGAILVRGFNAFAGLAPLMACKRREAMTPEVKEGYLMPYDSYSNRIAIHRFVQDIPTRRGHATYALVADIDAKLRLFRDRPMAVFWGQRDFCFNERFLQGWIERFPQAKVHRFPDAGHLVLEDAYDQILPELRMFISEPCPLVCRSGPG